MSQIRQTVIHISHGRIREMEHYLEDRSHEDRESRQKEHKGPSDSLFPEKETLLEQI